MGEVPRSTEPINIQHDAYKAVVDAMSRTQSNWNPHAKFFNEGGRADGPASPSMYPQLYTSENDFADYKATHEHFPGYQQYHVSP